MELVLWREESSQKSTLGELYINGEFECYTLEDVVREVPGKPVKEWKIKKETAIPFGKYKLDITYSPKYKCEMPIVCDVPGFVGIRIHSGNTDIDTEGCLLVGTWRQHADKILGSRLAFAKLLTRLKVAKAQGEAMTIDIRSVNQHGHPRSLPA